MFFTRVFDTKICPNPYFAPLKVGAQGTLCPPNYSTESPQILLSLTFQVTQTVFQFNAYRTPLHHVAEKGHINTMKALLDKASLCADKSQPGSCTINLQDNDNESALYIAALNEHKQFCQILIDAGVIIDVKSRR